MAERSEIERFQRAQDLLRRLRSLSPQEREAVLDAECEGDADLREEVVSLLAVEDEGPDSVLDATSPGHRVRGFLTEPPPPEINAPVQVGPHRIVRLIGEGGMGAVYEAEQAEPRRRIAVKVLRNGLASPEARRRFQREAEVLGRLRHPGIAMLHEAGIDDTHSRYGAPWFSMELVEGRPITLHVQDQEDITKEGKLELLTQLCSAVAHAHHEGVVHRDLKPDNILVDRQGQVRVLDFGIARTADAIGEGQTSLTRTGDVIGTLAYMSPEQALGRPDLIDGRSDVYSIGVIAFELLTGRLPHDLDELGLPAALHEITESEADRLGSLDGSLRGDLEAIIGKALEKDRDRRYASVDEFLDDLERYLRHQPVVARPPTLRYRLARFIRRNRAVSAALALTLLTLVTAVIVTTNKALEANASAAEARYSQYVAQLQAASAALGDEDPESARAHLDRAPEPLREFEWHHLHSRLDASLLHVVLPFPIQWDSALPAVFRRAETGSLSVLRILGKTSLLDVDLQTGEQRVSWRARPGETLLTLSPDGEHCLLRSANQVLLVHLESDSRRELAPFPGEHSESFIFSPAGRWVVIKSREPPGLLVHAVPGGDRILELEMPDFSHLLLFATDTSLLIHSKTEPTRLVELPSGRTVHWFEDSDDWIRFCASSSANRVVAGVGDDSTTARDLSTGKAAPWVNSRSAKASPARFLDFDPTGRWLAIAQDDRMQRLLDGQSGRQLRELGRAAHATPWLRAFSSDGDWLAVSTDSGVLKAVPTTSDRPPS
ncbi:MAG: serine/threonine-protein kinase, partial [Acidobacteriota bacterium]